MKIAYIDAKVNAPEDYSINPKRYGGGGVVARYAKELLNNADTDDVFHVYASRDCFDNLSSSDNGAACFAIHDEMLEYLKRGAPVAWAIPNADSYDLFLHHHDCMSFNMAGLTSPLVHWALMGNGRANHPDTPYSLLYVKNDKAVYGTSFHVQLGKPVPTTCPAFEENPGGAYIFQCTRHDDAMNSVEVAKWCRTRKVQGYFAGPIVQAGYPINKEIDGVYTHWLGCISEEDKLRYYRGAQMAPLLVQWDPPFNQSALEALSQGCPVVSNPRGFMGELIEDGVNGWCIGRGVLNLDEAWERSFTLSRERCWQSSRDRNEVAMIRSFREAFESVLKDWARRKHVGAA